VDTYSTCVNNPECDDMEYYNERSNECVLKPDCDHGYYFNNETYTCSREFDCWDIRTPWFMGGHCVEECDGEQFMRDEMTMECKCMDSANEYYRTEYDTASGEYLGGECTAIPNCTAGTQW